MVRPDTDRLTTTVLALRDSLRDVAVSVDAAPMSAYMRHRFEFLGVKAGPRRAAVRPILADRRTDGPEEILALADALWLEPEREFQHIGADVLATHAERLEPEHLDRVARLLTNKAWWDTVDALAAHTVGTMVRRHRMLGEEMDRWIEHDDDTTDGPESEMWLARTALLHQLRWKDDTDADRLFRHVLRRAGDQQFFLRKAAGWALRQYARTDPDAVGTFVDRHRDVLSTLTVREATKHL